MSRLETALNEFGADMDAVYVAPGIGRGAGITTLVPENLRIEDMISVCVSRSRGSILLSWKDTPS